MADVAQEIAGLRLQIEGLQRMLEDESRKTLDSMRKKDAALKELTKETDTLKKDLKKTQKQADETKRFFREALQQNIEKLTADFQVKLEAAMDAGDRMIRANVDEVINRKFELGFTVIEKECRTLFNRISDEVATRAEKERDENRAKINDQMQTVEKSINGRARDFISMKTNNLEYAWTSMISKSFVWAVNNFQECVMQMLSRKESSAAVCSPVFTLALCPRMFLEIHIENISRGSASNEWIAEDDDPVHLGSMRDMDNTAFTAGHMNLALRKAPPVVRSRGEDGRVYSSIHATPIAGNVTLSLYMQRRMHAVKMKVSLGPPGSEVARIVTEKDFIYPQDEADAQGNMTSSLNAVRIGVQSGGVPGLANYMEKPKKKQQDILAGAHVRDVLATFKEDEKGPRKKFDPLDMTTLAGHQSTTQLGDAPPAPDDDLINVPEDDKLVELRLQNFVTIHRVWCRKTNRIPVKVEVLECSKYRQYKKKVAMPGMNFNMREDMQTYDQFLAPNFVAHQVNGWVDKIRNKTRKSAVWEVPHIQELCKLIPSGNYVESQIFRLAGLDAVRLVFYPNGLDHVPMQCAVFLKSCSEENSFTVRAVLSVNKTQKVFQGDMRASLGKKKFCSLQGVEKATISVEITEIADHPLTLHTIRKYDRLEDVYRLEPPAGLSTLCNNTMTSRPSTVSIPPSVPHSMPGSHQGSHQGSQGGSASQSQSGSRPGTRSSQRDGRPGSSQSNERPGSSGTQQNVAEQGSL